MKIIILTQKNRLKLSSKKLEIVKYYYFVKPYYAQNYHECKTNKSYFYY